MENNEQLLEGLAQASFLSQKLTESDNITDALYDWLKYLIETERIPNGFRFPNEVRFCEILGVSRGTLREVYSRSVQSGLIKKNRGGTQVCFTGVHSQPKKSFHAIGPEKLEELVVLRSMLEIGAAKLATKSATEEDIATLQTQINMIQKFSDDLHLTMYYDAAFHYCLASATHNSTLINVLNQLRPVIDTALLQLYMKHPKIVANAYDAHTELLKAIREHDVEKATFLMTQHMHEVEKLIKFT